MKLHLCILGLVPAVGAALAAGSPIYSYDFEQPEAATDAAWSSTLRDALGGPYTTVLGRFASERVNFDLLATAENTAGLGGSGGGSSGGGFNVTVDQHNLDRQAQGYPEQGGFGGSGNFNFSNPPGGTPTADLGSIIQQGGGGNGEIAFGRGTYALTFDLMLFDSWDADSENFGPDSFAVEINGERKFDELLEVHWLPNNFRQPDELPEQNAYSNAWRDQIYRDIRLEFDVSEAMERFSFSFIGTTSQPINDESWGLDNVRVEHLPAGRGMGVPEVPTPGVLALLGTGLGMCTRRSRKN